MTCDASLQVYVHRYMPLYITALGAIPVLFHKHFASSTPLRDVTAEAPHLSVTRPKEAGRHLVGDTLLQVRLRACPGGLLERDAIESPAEALLQLCLGLPSQAPPARPAPCCWAVGEDPAPAQQAQ